MLKKIKIFLKNHQNLDIRKKKNPYWKADKRFELTNKMVPSHIRQKSGDKVPKGPRPEHINTKIDNLLLLKKIQIEKNFIKSNTRNYKFQRTLEKQQLDTENSCVIKIQFNECVNDKESDSLKQFRKLLIEEQETAVAPVPHTTQHSPRKEFDID